MENGPWAGAASASGSARAGLASDEQVMAAAATTQPSATFRLAIVVLIFAMTMLSPTLFTNVLFEHRRPVGCGEFHLVQRAGRADAVIETSAVGIGPGEHRADHARRMDVEALLGCSREQHHRAEEGGHSQDRFDCCGHFYPPSPRATRPIGGQHKLVNKVSKLYVGKSKMSQQVAGLYLGLESRRMNSRRNG